MKTIKLENQRLIVEIGNDHGAKVLRYFDKLKGKDWVWKSENIKDDAKNQSIDLNASFDQHWSGGWEEIFPNDYPTQIDEFKLVDHGETWRRSWTLDHANGKQVHFVLNCETYPIYIEKTFKLDASDPILHIDYQLTSRSTKALPFILKLHPALKIEQGDRFKLPRSFMRPVTKNFSRILGRNERTAFPVGLDSHGETITIDQIRPYDGHQREYVVIDELEQGRCALYNSRTQTQLQMTFPKEQMPYVWLLQSYGGYYGHYVAVLGPSNAGHPDLNEAQKIKSCGTIRPGQILNYSFKFELI